MHRTGYAVPVLAMLALVFFVTSALAQDPVKTNPKTTTQKFENEKIRVLEWNSKPGQKDAMHQHPDVLIYVVAGGTYTSTTPDGKATVITVKAGDTMYRKAIVHTVENTGKTALKSVLVEFKEEKAK